MPRAMRVEYPGVIYHVMDRGNRREDIFVNDVDRQDLVKTPAEACEKTGWQESDLAGRHRSEPGKLAIAARLRKETTLSVKWIAARVKIGTTKGAKSVLHRLKQHQTARNSESCAQLEFQSTV
jgi:hypothetical protein